MRKNKDINNVLKDTGILCMITLIAGLVLGFMYELTKEPIRMQKEQAIQRACQEVFAEADSFEVLTYAPTGQVLEGISDMGVKIGTVFEAEDAYGNCLGYVVETTSDEGYGGSITLYAGITIEGKLNGISILSISETPGLGMNAENILVPQFENVEAVSFSYTKSGSTAADEIDAISGATITTKAVVNAVNGAVYIIEQDFRKGGSLR